MRTPESTIKAAILHPVEEIRTKALDYFGRYHAHDTTLMPQVIQAVEKYGRDKAFSILRGADDLPQTEETVKWLTAELAKDWHLDDVNNDNYCFAVALILCRTRTALLHPLMADLRCFPEELKDRFLNRLEMASWDWQTGWFALEELGREVRDRGEYRLKRTGDSCTMALPCIGGDVVVKALADHWHRGDGEYRRGAAEIMGHIHTDLSLQTLLEFFPHEKDEDTAPTIRRPRRSLPRSSDGREPSRS